MFNRIGVIGNKDSILAFKAAGFEVFDAADAPAAHELIKKLTREQFAVVLITEDLAAKVEDVLKKAKAKPYPIFLPIPFGRVSSGFGMAGVKKDIEKAIGRDLELDREG